MDEGGPETFVRVVLPGIEADDAGAAELAQGLLELEHEGRFAGSPETFHRKGERDAGTGSGEELGDGVDVWLEAEAIFLDGGGRLIAEDSAGNGLGRGTFALWSDDVLLCHGKLLGGGGIDLRGPKRLLLLLLLLLGDLLLAGQGRDGGGQGLGLFDKDGPVFRDGEILVEGRGAF